MAYKQNYQQKRGDRNRSKEQKKQEKQEKREALAAERKRAAGGEMEPSDNGEGADAPPSTAEPTDSAD